MEALMIKTTTRKILMLENELVNICVHQSQLFGHIYSNPRAGELYRAAVQREKQVLNALGFAARTEREIRSYKSGLGITFFSD